MKKKDDTKDIYIILSYSGTNLSRLIRIFSHAEFSHVSISLDEDLKRMYSFGRLHAYNPFLAGLVHESAHYGTFKRFKDTLCEVYSLKIKSSQYETIEKTLNKMIKERKKYSFNIVGLVAAGMNVKYKPKKSFYCAQFVKHLLDIALIDIGLPEIIKPIDFRKPKEMNLEYKGLLRKYKKELS